MILYLARGIIKVKARGFWFTSGGEKESFGHYPHLKTKKGLPLYPDTQVKGNICMALNWLEKLQYIQDKELIRKTFNCKNRDSQYASLLKVNDLTLTEKSVNKWNQGGNRFYIKPRIEIDDKTRAVKKHMLVNMELAYLDGLELESKIYLGYFKSKENLQTVKQTLDNAVELLSGFGAFRSRGYSSGKIKIEWEDTTTINSDAQQHVENENKFTLYLNNLTNFRNKPIESDKTQLIESLNIITSDQIRGWFVRTYHQMFDKWPNADQMRTISFSSLFPSPLNSGKLFYPAAFTVLKEERGKIFDTYNGPEPVNPDEENKKDLENFYKTKTKPLPGSSFLTNNKEPLVFTLRKERRMRNHLGDNFLSLKKGGLFVQEVISEKVTFGGTLHFINADEEFKKEALFIVNNVMPIINGTIFENTVETAAGLDEQKGEKFLVAENIPFTPEMIVKEVRYIKNSEDRVVKENAEQLFINTSRAFYTSLSRLRRKKISIAPGSVLNAPVNGKGIFWLGFGAQDIKQIDHGEGGHAGENGNGTAVNLEPYDFPVAKLVKLSKSQIGVLRSFAENYKDTKLLQKRVNDILEKYKQWNKVKLNENLIPVDLLETIKDDLLKSDLTVVSKKIDKLLKEVYLHKWDAREKKIKEKFVREGVNHG